MATEQELIDSVKALPDTQAFFAGNNAVTDLGVNGSIKTYTHIKTVDSSQVRSQGVKLYINPAGEAFFLGRDPIPSSSPEPRVNEAQVRGYNGGVYAEALNINISYLEATADRITFDLPDGSGSFKTKEAIVRYNGDGSVKDVLIRDLPAGVY